MNKPATQHLHKKGPNRMDTRRDFIRNAFLAMEHIELACFPTGGGNARGGLDGIAKGFSASGPQQPNYAFGGPGIAGLIQQHVAAGGPKGYGDMARPLPPMNASKMPVMESKKNLDALFE